MGVVRSRPTSCAAIQRIASPRDLQFTVSVCSSTGFLIGKFNEKQNNEHKSIVADNYAFRLEGIVARYP